MLKPVFKIEYENKDITIDIAPYVLSIDYTDFEHGQSDEIEIQLEDAGKLWQGCENEFTSLQAGKARPSALLTPATASWYPSKGDTLNLQVGYEGDKLLNCGSFEIDEIEYSSPPDVITLKALATNIKKALRQENSIAYENKTLKQIAQEIASRHNLKLIGDIKEIKVKRITQNKEKDLTFLKNLAEQYGYIFKIADGQLVFYETEKLKSEKAAIILTKQDFTSINLREKAHEKYKACSVSYHNPDSKTIISTIVRADGIVNGDVLKINARCENKEQAIVMAQVALANKNASKIEGTLSLIGTPHLVAGLNIEIKGIGNFSGKYHIKQVKHSIDKNTGYTTSLEIESC